MPLEAVGCRRVGRWGSLQAPSLYRNTSEKWKRRGELSPHQPPSSPQGLSSGRCADSPHGHLASPRKGPGGASRSCFERKVFLHLWEGEYVLRTRTLTPSSKRSPGKPPAYPCPRCHGQPGRELDWPVTVPEPLNSQRLVQAPSPAVTPLTRQTRLPAGTGRHTQPAPAPGDHPS